jgi:hypothetical protein
MQIAFTVLKLLVVLFFLIKFLRRPSVVWGIGLLTVTTAVLLDTLLGTFDRDALLGELGFFFYVIAGALLAGSAAWFWGVVRPWLPGSAGEQGSGGAGVMALAPRQDYLPNPLPQGETARSPLPDTLPQSEGTISPAPLPPRSPAPPPLPPPRPAGHEDGYAAAGYDRQMLYEEIRHRFSRDDLQDLMFDLDVNELDVVVPGQTNDELIVRIMDAADDNGQTGAVALAVERILTPPPPEYLPRPEKLSVESPRTVIRHYLLAHYSVEQLQALAVELGIDWEQLDAGTKKDKTRALLLYLYRRNRLADLLHAIQAEAQGSRGAGEQE